MITLDWYLAYTEPKAEDAASYWLGKNGFLTFFPVIKKQRHRRGKNSRCDAPVFPNYLFVGTGPERRLAEISEERGVIDLVRVGDTPVAVPRPVIRELRDAMKNGQFVDDPRSGEIRYVRPGMTRADLERFKVGEEVFVTSGPFVDFIGQILVIGGRGKIEAVLSAFGRQIKVWLPADSIKPRIASEVRIG